MPLCTIECDCRLRAFCCCCRVCVLSSLFFVCFGFCFSTLVEFSLFFDNFVVIAHTHPLTHATESYGEGETGAQTNTSTNTSIRRMEYYTHAAMLIACISDIQKLLLLLLLFAKPFYPQASIHNYIHSSRTHVALTNVDVCIPSSLRQNKRSDAATTRDDSAENVRVWAGEREPFSNAMNGVRGSCCKRISKVTWVIHSYYCGSPFIYYCSIYLTVSCDCERFWYDKIIRHISLMRPQKGSKHLVKRGIKCCREHYIDESNRSSAVQYEFAWYSSIFHRK